MPPPARPGHNTAPQLPEPPSTHAHDSAERKDLPAARRRRLPFGPLPAVCGVSRQRHSQHAARPAPAPATAAAAAAGGRRWRREARRIWRPSARTWPRCSKPPSARATPGEAGREGGLGLSDSGGSPALGGARLPEEPTSFPSALLTLEGGSNPACAAGRRERADDRTGRGGWVGGWRAAPFFLLPAAQPLSGGLRALWAAPRRSVWAGAEVSSVRVGEGGEAGSQPGGVRSEMAAPHNGGRGENCWSGAAGGGICSEAFFPPAGLQGGSGAGVTFQSAAGLGLTLRLRLRTC